MQHGEVGLEQVLAVDFSDVAAGAFTVDTNQRIATWNDAAERLLGYTRAEVIGRPCCDVLTAGQRHRSRLCDSHCALMGSGARHPIPAVEIHVVTRSGAVRRLEMSTFLARTGAGQPRVVHILRDPFEHHPLAEKAPRIASHAHAHAGLAAPDQPHPDPDGRADADAATQLTFREREVLKLLARGLSTADIATTLGVTRLTARNHVSKIMAKLDVKSRLQAVVEASRLGLV